MSGAEGSGGAPVVKLGRPSTFTQAAADAICDHLAEGGLLLDYCRREGAPPVSTVYRWMEAHETFREAYRRAREVGLHLMAEEVIGISDDGSRDYVAGPDGREVPDHDHIARSRLRVDSRKWLASKLLPKVYGDKQVIDLNDSRPLSSVPAAVLVEAVRALAAKQDGEAGE